MVDTRKFIERVKAGKVPGLCADPDNPALAYDPMSIDSTAGTRGRFTGHGGYESQQARARELLVVDGIYTVTRTDIGDWSSSVELLEVPGEPFNTVMFAAA